MFRARKLGKFFAATAGVVAIAASIGLTAHPANAVPPTPEGADQYTTGTPHITIEKGEHSTEPGKAAERFVAIQVFKADVTLDDAQTASNISWGDSIDTTKIYDNLKNSEVELGTFNETWKPDDGMKGTAEDYNSCTTLGELFKAYCQTELSVEEANINSGTVTAKQVAQFLQHFGYNQNDEETNTAYKSPSPYTSSEVARAFTAIVKSSLKEDSLDSMTEGNDNSPDANKWTSRGLKQQVSSSDVTDAFTDGSGGIGWVIDNIDGTTSEGLPTGYYVVYDTFKNGDKTDALSENLLQLVDDKGIVVSLKSDAPSFDKKLISDDNEVVADSVAVGDEVTYVLRGTLPENLDSYKSYKMVFTDKPGASLSIKEGSIHIYVDAAGTASGLKAIQALPEVGDVQSNTDSTTQPGYSTSEGLVVKIPDIKTMSPKSADLGTITHDSAIIVTYTVSVQNTAPVGVTAAPALQNGAHMDFSNDPNFTGTPDESPLGQTPEVKTTLYTYGLDVTKHLNDADNATKVKGAGIALLQATDGGASVTQANMNSKDRPTNNEKIAAFTRAGSSDEDYVYTFAGWTTVNDGLFQDGKLRYEVTVDLGKGAGSQTYYLYAVTPEAGVVHFKGLDEGCYTAFEAKTPAGYDTMDAYSFKLDATETLTESTLTATGNASDGNLQKFNPGTPEQGTASLHVSDFKGVDLPATGGVGTALFIAAGVTLVVVACAYTAARKRQADAE